MKTIYTQRDGGTKAVNQVGLIDLQENLKSNVVATLKIRWGCSPTGPPFPSLMHTL